MVAILAQLQSREVAECKWEQFSTFPYSCNFQNQESEFFPEYHKKIKNIDTDTSSTVY